MIPVYQPVFAGREAEYLNDCIKSGWVSSQGKYIGLFEAAIAEYHGVEHAIATSSCTTALHLALAGLGIGPGDEVLCPDLTFIAPANMIALCGADLVLVDIDPATLTIAPAKLEQHLTPATKAIMVVHQFGHAAHMDEIIAFAKTHGLRVIEDNAEAIGGKYKNGLLGTFGDIAAFSFFGNKIITTGEGGALITNDDGLAKRVRLLRDHGMNPEKRYDHLELGFNYRMTNMQAAIGLAQIERLSVILDARNRQWQRYEAALAGIDQVATRPFAPWCTPVHWLMTIAVEAPALRDELLAYLAGHGIEARPMINPVHRARHFVARYDASCFPHSSDLSARSLHLPSGGDLSADEIDFIASTIGAFFER